MSSTLLKSPLANWMSDPLAKLPGTVLLLSVLLGDLGGELVAANFPRKGSLWRSKGAAALGFASSGLVRIRCLSEPSFPEGTLKAAGGCWLRLSLLVAAFTAAGGLKVDGGGRKVVLAVGVVGEKVSSGERGGACTKFGRIGLYGDW